MNRKRWIITALLIGVLLAAGFRVALNTDSEEPRARVSVIVDSSGDGRWLSFMAGLEQAAAERNLSLTYVNTGRLVSPVEEKKLADNELADGSAGLIMEFCASRNVKEMVSELSRKSALVLVQTDVEAEADADGKFSGIHADNEALGRTLGLEISECAGPDLSGKTVAVLAGNQEQFAQKDRLTGLLGVLEERGAEVLWVSDYVQNMQERLEYRQNEHPADILAALDNTDLEVAVDYILGLRQAGSQTVPELFGVGCSEKNVYYLDNGIIRSMVVPHDYDMGYRAASAVADRLSRKLEPMEDYRTGFTAVRRENMFQEENERLLFPLAQ
ncbi:MAG: substrate-binding domain-containing protein [Clostridium sp.]|nr:substrate-binding domain-containing protein [Clostridium sp.]